MSTRPACSYRQAAAAAAKTMTVRLTDDAGVVYTNSIYHSDISDDNTVAFQHVITLGDSAAHVYLVEFANSSDDNIVTNPSGISH